MEKELAAYLYQYKNCPLPSIGALLLQPGKAVFSAGEKQFSAPIPIIELSSKENKANALIHFLATEMSITPQDADMALGEYCNTLKRLQPHEESPLSMAGSFYKDENDQLHFKSVGLPSAFFPEIIAERVVHQDTSHDMLVGDIQTNTAAMSEMLHAGEAKKKYWWWAAVIFAILGFALTGIYYTGQNQKPVFFGNIQQVEPKVSAKTYISSIK